MKQFDSFIGTLKNVRLTVKEKSDIRASVMRTRPSRLVPMQPGHLFAYEKALMFNALTGLVQQHAPKEAPDLKLTVWHGNVFQNLQPFVLRVTRD